MGLAISYYTYVDWKTLETNWKTFSNVCADLFLGVACKACGEPGQVVCDQCRDVVAQAPGVSVWRSCPTGGRWLGGSPAYVVGSYWDVFGALVVALKDHQCLQLAPLLGQALANAVSCLPIPRFGPLDLVPVPTARQAVRQRGYDHSVAVARLASRQLAKAGFTVQVYQALAAGSGNPDSTELSAAERWQADLSRFRVTKGCRGRKTIVVDDVITTGATTHACYAAMSQAGFDIIGVAAVAETERLY